MGKGGGTFLSFAGAILSIAGFPYIGLPLMMGGSIITQQALKKEAMERMKSAMMGLRMNTRTTERPIPVIYGRQRVGGNVLWMSTEGKNAADYDPPRNKLFMVFGISEGPIDGYEEMFFNDTKVWDARSGQLKTQFYNRFHSEFRTGTNSQAPFSHVATYHNLYDIASETFPLTAVALVELFYDPDVYQAVPNVSWTIRGKQVPDWTDANSPGIVKWTQSGPLQVADLLTNKQYGMGISSANLNVSDLTSAHLYATGAISPGSRSTVEIVDMSALRPKYYERNVTIPAVLGYVPNDDYFDPDPTGTTWNFRLTDKIPIKPGSLSFTGAHSSFVDVPRSGMISQFGQLFTTPGSVAVGSVNYLNADVWVKKPAEIAGEPYGEMTLDFKVKWYADWEFSYRTKYQNIARSMYVVSTPETLVETGSVVDNVVNLISTQGGAGTFDYGTGALNAYFGAHEWYDNQPVEVWYRVSTRARFSTNYPLFEPEKVMDAVKNIQSHYRGFLVYANGKYGVRADKAEGSVYSFNDDNIIAGTFRLHQPSIKEIPTKVTLKYLDALNNFTPAEASFDVRSVDPGMEIEHVLDMPGMNARDEAMAMSYSYANLANLVNFIEFETNHNAIGVEAGDVVDVTHPSAAWVGKLFRVLSISFAKDDKLAISAIEHDTTAYVDDWIQGPMVSRNPSFFPKRSYWPPNVSSATLSEYSRTLSDGTTMPIIKYQIMAVDSAYLAVDHWNIYYSNAARGQQTRLGYSGVNTVGYLSPVEPGWNNVAIHAVSQFGNESAKVWTGSVNVGGLPEYEWMKWRVLPKDMDRSVIGSLAIDLSGIPSYLHEDASLYMLKGTYSDVGFLDEIVVYKMGIGTAPSITKTFSCHNDQYPGSIGLASSGHIGLYYWDGQAGAYEILKLTANSLTTVASAQWTTYSLGEGAGGSPLWMGANSVGGFVFSKFKNNSLCGIRWTTFSTGNMWVNTAWTSVMSSTQEGISALPSGVTVWNTNSHFVMLMSGFYDTGSGKKFKISHAVYTNDMATCVVSPHQVYLASKVCSYLTGHSIPGGGYQGFPGVFTTNINGDSLAPEGAYAWRRMLGILTNPTSSNALAVLRETNVAINANDVSNPFITSSGDVVLLSLVSSPFNTYYPNTVAHEIKFDRFHFYKVGSDSGLPATVTWI